MMLNPKMFLAPTTEAALEEALSRPTNALCRDLETLDGDILLLGVGGKIGPSLARMARRGLDAVGRKTQRVIAVARFSDTTIRAALDANGIETIAADLTDQTQIAELPDAANIVFLAGQKFGTTDAPEATWLMNAHVPALVAERFAPTGARFVVFSSGCVYPNVPVSSGGSQEEDALEPLGEYAYSCIARERLFTHFGKKYDAPALFFRLNYAVDLRYGVLVDVAAKVRNGRPIDVSMGYANVLWQGDANAYALRCLHYATNPPQPLNVTGPETVSIRAVAEQFGAIFGRPPQFVGSEADTALLSNAERAFDLLGTPEIPLETLIAWVAAWQQNDGRLLNKPTHYETRDGRY
jgi:nucleoside-diphosphate-sugar epimerase